MVTRICRLNVLNARAKSAQSATLLAAQGLSNARVVQVARTESNRVWLVAAIAAWARLRLLRLPLDVLRAHLESSRTRLVLSSAKRVPRVQMAFSASSVMVYSKGSVYLVRLERL